jgi:hypothetical protein
MDVHFRPGQSNLVTDQGMRVFGQHTYLANSIDNELIPASNNALEMVIRRFDQHYQNFCGFESIATARLHLGVFEKIYRFTPFSNDARPGIRGKSSLQLAGFDLSLVPMSWLCRLTG